MELIHCDTVDKLFNHLNPSNPGWKDWYFRGVHSENYQLIPTVWRDEDNINNMYSKFKNKVVIKDDEVNDMLEKYENIGCPVRKEYLIELITRNRFENYILHIFYYTANHAGLKISIEDMSVLNSFIPNFWYKGYYPGLLSAKDYKSYIDREKFSFGANTRFNRSLPQHYGTPTSLLDFTSHPWKALFFSFNCNNIQCECIHAEHNCCIYAINHARLNSSAFPRPPIEIDRTYYRYANKFLHAQDGLFVTIKSASAYFLEKGCWPTLDQAYDIYGDKSIIFQKITYPTCLNNEIFYRLKQCGISASTLMPGYQAVSDEIRQYMKINDSVE